MFFTWKITKSSSGSATTDASQLTTGVLSDGRVQESNVTQHQAAIQLTESQITDLSHTDADALHKSVSGEIAALTTKVTPIGADFLVIEDSADTNNKKKILIQNLPSSGAGEANTGSNVGASGAEVFKEKQGVDLRFRKLKAGSAKITITQNADDVELEITEDYATVAQLGAKADQTSLDTTNNNVTTNADAIALKASQSDLNTTNNNVTTNADAIALKADQSALNNTNSNVSSNTSAIGLKADQTSLDSTNTNVSNNATAIGNKYEELFNNVGNSTGATAINFTSGNLQSLTLTGNITATFSNLKNGGAYTLILKQDATGSRTVTWPASMLWAEGTAPTLTTDANGIDTVSFIYDGTNQFATALKGFA